MMEEQSNGNEEGTSTPSRIDIASKKKLLLNHTVSPMRMYVAHCILDLRHSLPGNSVKRTIPSYKDHLDEKETEVASSTVSSRVRPSLPKPISILDSRNELNVKDGYLLFRKAMNHFESYPLDEHIDIQSFSCNCGLSVQMTLCILTVLNYLGMTAIVSNSIIKRSHGVSSSYLQELTKSWNSYHIPSLLDKTSFVPNSFVTGQRGVTVCSESSFPYSVNPSHYDCPYHPEESLDQTDNRIDWSYIPSKRRQSSYEKEVDFSFSGIPVFCHSDRMAEIMEKYCQLLLKELVDKKEFSLKAFLSKTIHSNYLFIEDRLSCIRLIVYVLHYLQLIQIQNRPTVDSFELSCSHVLQITSVFENLLAAKNDRTQIVVSKESVEQFVKEMIQIPFPTPQSIRCLLTKHFPLANYPSMEDVKLSLEDVTKSFLLSYQQSLDEQSFSH